MALFVRQEAPGLPVVQADDETAVLDLLCSEREALLVDAGRLRNQLHALLMQVDPEYQSHLPRLDSAANGRVMYVFLGSGTVLLVSYRKWQLTAG